MFFENWLSPGNKKFGYCFLNVNASINDLPFKALTNNRLKLDIPPRKGGSTEKKAIFICVVLLDSKINAFVDQLCSRLDIKRIKIENIQVLIMLLYQTDIVGILLIFSSE